MVITDFVRQWKDIYYFTVDGTEYQLYKERNSYGYHSWHLLNAKTYEHLFDTNIQIYQFLNTLKNTTNKEKDALLEHLIYKVTPQTEVELKMLSHFL